MKKIVFKGLEQDNRYVFFEVAGGPWLRVAKKPTAHCGDVYDGFEIGLGQKHAAGAVISKETANKLARTILKLLGTK